jgi:hypothetical protein
MQGQKNESMQDGTIFLKQSNNPEDQCSVGIPITSKLLSGESKFSGAYLVYE